MSNIVQQFREKTDKLFHAIDGYSASELEQLVRRFVNYRVMECSMDSVIEDVVLTGSRCRGLEREDSDMDFVVYYSGREREDLMFDILNEPEYEIGGVRVDINPIMEEKTGTLEWYLQETEKYLSEKL